MVKSIYHSRTIVQKHGQSPAAWAGVQACRMYPSRSIWVKSSRFSTAAIRRLPSSVSNMIAYRRHDWWVYLVHQRSVARSGRSGVVIYINAARDDGLPLKVKRVAIKEVGLRHVRHQSSSRSDRIQSGKTTCGGNAAELPQTTGIFMGTGMVTVPPLAGGGAKGCSGLFLHSRNPGRAWSCWLPDELAVARRGTSSLT